MAKSIDTNYFSQPYDYLYGLDRDIVFQPNFANKH